MSPPALREDVLPPGFIGRVLESPTAVERFQTALEMTRRLPGQERDRFGSSLEKIAAERARRDLEVRWFSAVRWLDAPEPAYSGISDYRPARMVVPNPPWTDRDVTGLYAALFDSSFTDDLLHDPREAERRRDQVMEELIGRSFHTIPRDRVGYALAETRVRADRSLPTGQDLAGLYRSRVLYERIHGLHIRPIAVAAEEQTRDSFRIVACQDPGLPSGRVEDAVLAMERIRTDSYRPDFDGYGILLQMGYRVAHARYEAGNPVVRFDGLDRFQ